MPSVSLPAASLHSLRIRLSLFLLIIAGVLLPSSASAQVAFTGAQRTVASGFSFPSGVAVDSNGNLYVAVAGGTAIEEIQAVNGVVPASPTTVTLANSFNGPNSVAVDASGNVYVADTNNNEVKEIVAVGGTIPSSPTIRTLASITLPYDLVLDGSGNLYVAAGCNGTLGASHINAEGSGTNCGGVIELLAVGGVIPDSPTEVVLPGSYNSPTGLALDSSGNLFVADSGNNALEEILAISGSVSASSTTSTVASVDAPSGVALDSNGNIYVSSWNNGHVYEVLGGGTLFPIGSGWAGPAGMAADASGNLFIADISAGKITELHVGNLPFGSQAVASTSITQSLNFHIITGTTVGSVAVLTSGIAGLDFNDAGSSTCTAKTYSSNTDCVINVSFRPVAAGSRNGAVVLYDGSGNALATVPVYGNGVGPQAAFGPGVQSSIGSGFDTPIATAIDGAGNIYVTDEGTQSVYKIAPGGAQTTIGSGFGSPRAVAVDGAGNVYVSDVITHILYKITPGGVQTQVLTGLWSQGLAFDGAGNLYIASFNPGAVYKLAPDGTQTTIGSGIQQPFGIAVDTAGDVFVTSSGPSFEEDSLYEITPTGTQTIIDSTFSQSWAVAVDASGNAYVTDKGAGKVYEVTPSGTQTLLLSSPDPIGIALDRAGNIVVVDAQAKTVTKIDRGDVPSLTFATTNAGSTSSDSPKTITLQNIGNATLTLSALSYPADFPEGSGDGAACTSSASISAGLLCDLPITFAPLSGGSLSESVAITDNTLNATNAVQSIGVSGTSQTVTPTHFVINTSASPTSGGAFNVIVTAVDGSNNTVTTYTGPVHFSSSDPQATLPANSTLTSGTGTFLVTLVTLGSQSITVADASNASITSTQNVTVVPGAAALFVVSAPSTATVNNPFSFTVTAYDVLGNVASGYAGTVQFTSTDASATLPALTTLTAGTGTFSATLVTAGSKTITATDSVTNTILGTSSAIAVTVPNLVVTTNIDDGGSSTNCSQQTTPGTGTDALCSLRDALQYATDHGSASITFDANAFPSSNSTAENTITLINGALPLSTYTTVTGPTTGAGATLTNLVTVSGANAFNVFYNDTPNLGVVLNSLNVTGGIGDYGAGIVNNGSMTVNGSVISNNSTTATVDSYAVGSGVLNAGTMVLNSSTVFGNVANGNANGGVEGSGIANQGTMTISNSTISNNTATSSGGSIPLGGGVYSEGPLTVTNSTISGNTVAGGGSGLGGGIYSLDDLTVVNSTIANNSADNAGGIYLHAGTATLANSIVSTNSATSNNDIFNEGATLNTDSTNQIGAAGINLAPLANYGGTTQTQLPQPGSPAICGGSVANDSGLSVDQRGNPRTTTYNSTTCVDSGAVQTNYALTFSTEPPSTVAVNQAISPAPVVQLTESGAAAATASVSVSMSDSASLLGGTDTASVSSGLATFSNLLITGATTNDTLTATTALNSSINLTVTSDPVTASKTTPTITWSDPSAITYGTALSGTQLNATASVAGAFVYSPASGTVLNAGSQTLGVTFTPTDTTTYSTATASVNLTVNQATPSITWANPSAITYATALSGTQLNATSPVDGTFVYSPASGTVLGAGSQTLGVTFTPTDTANYTTATASATLTVNQATPSITWANPSAITYGTALSGTQLNATSPVAGAFVYSPASGTVLNAGSQSLGVTFTPTDTTNYTTATAGVTLVVNQATPQITWANPAPINYGTALSGTQLNASANVAGTFAYTPATGAVLSAGPQTLGTLFTPTDTTNYTTASANASLVVDQAAALVSPAASSTLPGSSTTFSWTTGGGITAYELWLSTSGIGLKELYNSGPISGTSTMVSVPANGVTVYVRLWSQINGVWQGTDYVVTESGTPTPAVLSSPTPGSTLSGSSVTFSWTAGSGPSAYQLWLGSTGVGSSDLYNSGAVTATSASVTNLPTNGVKLYARLWSKINGVWQGTDYTYTQGGSPTKADLSSPTPGGTLPGSSASFSWTTGGGVTGYQLWLGSTGVGSNDVYNSGSIHTTSANVSGIPTNGVTLYARLWSYINGAWQGTDYTYTEAGTPAKASLTLPTPGSTLSGSSASFSWTNGTGVTAYQLWVGSTGIGSSDLYNSGSVNTTSTSVSGLPTSGVMIYARLWSKINGTWQGTDYTYTAAGTPTKAAMSSPVPSTTLSGSNITFTWTAGTGVSSYELWLGVGGVGSSDLYNSGAISGTSTGVTGLPTGGVTLYARLWSKINGVWQGTDYTYTEAGSPTKAVLSSPAPGSTLSGSSASFSWTTGAGVSAYQLWLGTNGLGSSDVYNSGSINATSANVSSLPANGVTLYARLWSKINGTWQGTDYTYTQSGSPTKAALISPTPGSTLSGSSAAFSWSTGGGVTNFELWLGKGGVGSSDLYNSGVLPLSTTSVNVNSLPTSGAIVYARLWSQINGAWQATDYTYTASGSPVLAALTSPTPGSQLTDTTATFTWNAGSGPSNYELWLGTGGVGSSNLLNSGTLSGSTLSKTVSNLPTGGVTIYARMWSRVGTVWQYVDYTYISE